MATSNEEKISKAMSLLDEADEDVAIIGELSARILEFQQELLRVSNIMKTKHETVKNAISNIR